MTREDKIVIRDLKASCIIGINENERLEKQEVLINVQLFTDLKKAGRSDDIKDVVNYRTIKKNILSGVEKSGFHLLERLTEHIADICLEDTRVNRVIVSVDKPGALRFTRSVAVEIERSIEDV